MVSKHQRPHGRLHAWRMLFDPGCDTCVSWLCDLLCACLRAHEVWIEQSKALLRPGGVLAVLSPFTWLEKFVPQDNWLGGYRARSEVQRGRFDVFQLTLRTTSAFEPEEPQGAEL